MLPFSLRSAQRLSASEMKTPLGEETEAYEIECSTPFGIRDENTQASSVPRANFSGAQRLSASEMKTHAVNWSWSERRIVLNAFRHQR